MLHWIASVQHCLHFRNTAINRRFSLSLTRAVSKHTNSKETKKLAEQTQRLLAKNPGYPITHVDFNKAIDSWAKAAPNVGKYAATQAENLLNHVETLHKSKKIRLETVTYNSCLNAYAKCNGGVESALKAQNIFNRRTWKKNHISFHCLMDAWNKSKSFKAGHRSQSKLLFHKMQRWGLKPNVRTYSLLITSLDANEASDVLRRMINNYLENDGVCPDIIIFNNVLKAW